MHSPLILLFLTSVFFKGTLSLRDVRLSVPDAARLGESLTFNCAYQLEGDTLYTVKWYKFQDEFYRYTPKDNPPTKIFEVTGITENSIQKDKSNGTQLTLRKMTEVMGGLYSCEVSADAPSFQTALATRLIVVVDPPKEKPVISGLKHKYRLGDVLVAICTAPGSSPAANISWSINNRIAEPKHVTERRRIVDNDLEQTISTLKIHARQHHFNGGRLRLKCGASIYQVYWQTAEKIVELDGKSGDMMQNGEGALENNDQQGWSPSWTNIGKHTPLPPINEFIGGKDLQEEPATDPNGGSTMRPNLQTLVLLWLTSAHLASFYWQ